MNKILQQQQQKKGQKIQVFGDLETQFLEILIPASAGGLKPASLQLHLSHCQISKAFHISLIPDIFTTLHITNSSFLFTETLDYK